MKRRRRNGDAPLCKGVTAKGEACTHRCLRGETGQYREFCGMHNPEKTTKKQKNARAKRATEHSHEPGQTDPTCELCRTHGDVLVPGDAGVSYVRLSMHKYAM